MGLSGLESPTMPCWAAGLRAQDTPIFTQWLPAPLSTVIGLIIVFHVKVKLGGLIANREDKVSRSGIQYFHLAPIGAAVS